MANKLGQGPANPVYLVSCVAAEGAALPASFVVIAGDDGVNTHPVQMDASGNLKVNVAAGGAAGGTSSTDDSAFTAGAGAGTPAMGFATVDTVDAGDVGVLAMDTSRRLLVSIEADNAGIGGGVQYTEGDTDATITGTAFLWEDAADTLRAVSAAKPLPVGDAGGSLTVDNADMVTVAGAVSGSEMQVDVVAPLPAGDNNIGNVDVVSGTITAVTDITNAVSVDDNGGSLTVDNADMSTVAGAVAGSEMQVDVVAPLPAGDNNIGNVDIVSGTVTAVTDITNVVSVDDNGGSLTVDNADMSTVAGAVSGSEMQVDVVAPLPVGANAIGKLAANSGVDIGDVDILSIAAGDNNIGNVDIASALPAGTNAIGKLAANSGVDIGDVDVTSVPRSVSGPGEPGTAVDSLSSVAVDVAPSQTAAELIATPGANKQIWVYGLHFMADTAAGTVLLQDSTPTNKTGTMAVSDEGGWVLPLSGNFSMPWFKCATNTALQMDNGACSVDGIITYAIVSV
jgi:hypothetical protein